MRSRSFHLDAVVVASLLFGAAGCFSPSYHSGDLQCGTDQSCPPDYHCAADHHCYPRGVNPDLAGQVTDLDMSPVAGSDLSARDMTSISPPDLFVAPVSYPPAAVWISSGGGAGVGSISNSSINLSVGGAIVMGRAAGSANGTVTFSYFSNDSIQ